MFQKVLYFASVQISVVPKIDPTKIIRPSNPMHSLTITIAIANELSEGN